MRITDLSLRNEAGALRAEALVIWEDVERDAFRLFVETDERHGDKFWADPNSFLISCLVPAWQAQERRIRVDGALCPVLCENARGAVAILDSWYPDVGRPPDIDPQQGLAPKASSQPKTIALMSSGIDSLAMLRWHRIHLPPDHPASIHAVLAVAFHPKPAPAPSSQEANPRLVPATKIARDAGVEPIGVRTNLRRLMDDGNLYSEKWHGSMLTGIASFFSRGFARAYIASSSSVKDLYPWGSHPLLDPYFSSAHFQVQHHGLQMSRFEKTTLVAGWPIAVQNLRVCQKGNTGATNCGTCFKCLTTMTALVALGKFENCRAFPSRQVTPELLYTIEEYEMIDDDYQLDWYRELIPALTECGRNDLVAAIDRICSE